MSEDIDKRRAGDSTEADSDTIVEVHAPRVPEVSGVIDRPSDDSSDNSSDNDDTDQVFAPVGNPVDTVDDRSEQHAANTLPFARGKRPQTAVPIRLDNDAPRSEPDRPVVGKRYLNYEIRRRLARGSMGLVYEANHLHLGRRVAIKFLSPNLLSDENMVYRFLGEARAMARLSHPGIPTVFDFGQDAVGNAYLIMDYLEGESLAAKLERNPIEFADAIEIAAQTSEILSAAHQENIVHRDLKPGNILLCDELRITEDGPKPIVRLIDFGICKARSDDGRAETVAGNLVGTPRYMSPEQTYSREISPKTDIYALGCVIYELVTGRPPFSGRLAQLVDAHRHDIADDIRVYQPTASPALAELVAQMLSKEPNARPSSGPLLAAALRRCKPRKAAKPTAPRRRRSPPPIPRAETARRGLEAGLLSPERTPLPFKAVYARPPSHGPPPSFAIASRAGDTTEVSLITPNLGAIATFACLALGVLFIAVWLVSG